MHDDNPTQIQFAKRYQSHTTPLILIHDGGGSTFGYFTLDSLNRDVHGIHNPHFFSGEPWTGGMDEMAETYIQLLKDANIAGTIFLGGESLIALLLTLHAFCEFILIVTTGKGWSLGGLLAIKMAHLLAHDEAYENEKIFVAGLLLIDSPFQIPWCKWNAVSEPLLPGLPALVRNCLDGCADLLDTWELPSWGSTAWKGRETEFVFNHKKFKIPPRHVYHKPLHGIGLVVSVAQSPEMIISDQNAADKDSQTSYPPPPSLSPPTSVLLRCTEKVPSKESNGHAVRVDRFRDTTMLNWDTNYPEFIKAVIDVESHHYNIFDLKKVRILFPY